MKIALLLTTLHFLCWGAVAPTHNLILFTIAGTACIGAILKTMLANELFTLYVSAPIETFRLVKVQQQAPDLKTAIDMVNVSIERGILQVQESDSMTLTIDHEEFAPPVIRGNGHNVGIYLEHDVTLDPMGVNPTFTGEPHDASPSTQVGFVWTRNGHGRTAFIRQRQQQMIQGGCGFVVAIPTKEKPQAIFEDCPTNGDVFKNGDQSYKIIFCFHQ